MRRTLLACLTASALLVSAVPALAHPTTALDPTLPTDVTFAATDNVEYLGRFPEHVATAGGKLLPDGQHFLITDPRGVYTYDVSDPASPTLAGSLQLSQTFGDGVDAVGVTRASTSTVFAQEDPDTDGRILLVDGAPADSVRGELTVVDVSDPTDLKVLSTVPVTDHTWTCVSGTDVDGVERGCAWAYGRDGHIVDLRDPADAKLSSSDWRDVTGYSGYTHDFTEIRPGLVMSAGAAALLLDTSDPENPVELTRIETRGRFQSLGYHSVEWANGGTDRWLIAGTEIAPGNAVTSNAGSDCEGENSVIETWDASEVLVALAEHDRGIDAETAFANRAFRRVDTFDAGSRGIFLQGAAPGHVLYCAHWMEVAPDFVDGGLMAVSYYDRGTRFVEVDAQGGMSEIGWFVPAEGYAGSPQFVAQDETGTYVYVMDYRRGMEILRITPTEATGVYHHGVDVIAAGSSVQPVSPIGESAPGFASGLVGLGLVALELRRRRRASA